MGREQAVKIGSHLSGWLPITSGVQQGSVLGPLLFILFVDDLVQELPRGISIKFYADDAKLYFIYKLANWTPVLQEALSVLERWTLKWDLRLAVAKCLLFFLGYANQKHAYTAFGAPLQEATVVRDLGVLISNDLTWFKHIASITSKASQRANAIFKAFTYSNFEMLARAYTVYVRPLLESASVVWSPHHLQDKRLLEAVQRKFSKRIFQRCKLPMATYEDRLQVLGWPTLEIRRSRADLVLVFNILKGFTSGSDGLITRANSRYTFRGNDVRLQGTRARLDLRKYFFVNRIVDRWNNLHIDINKHKTVNSFKLMLP